MAYDDGGTSEPEGTLERKEQEPCQPSKRGRKRVLREKVVRMTRQIRGRNEGNLANRVKCVSVDMHKILDAKRQRDEKTEKSM